MQLIDYLVHSVDKVAELLGSGSSGTVVRATDEASGMVVAVKLLHTGEMVSWREEVETKVYESLLEVCGSSIRYV